MSRELKADGDTWSARLSEQPADGDVRLVLFFCISSDQRPWRVAEVAAARVPDEESLDRLDESELRALYDASGSMDIPREYPSYGK